MAAKTLYLENNITDNWPILNDGTAQTAATTATGWTVSTGSTNHSEMESGVERAASTFTGTGPPDGSLDSTLGDAMRAGPFSGDFANANWQFDFAVRAVTNGGAQDGRIRFRIFKGANADGSGATEITAAQQQGSIASNVSTSADFLSSLTLNPGAISLINEYLFFQIAWERTGAGGMTSSDILLRTGSSGPAGTRIVTSDFTPKTYVQPGAVSHTYSPQTPKFIHTVKPDAVTHAYSPLGPKVSASVAPSVLSHSYTLLAPQAKAMVSVPVVSHSFTLLVPGLSVSEALPVMFENYKFVRVGDGMGTGDKIR